MIYKFGAFELDERLYSLRRFGEPLKLEPKVLDVLAYLIRQHDRVVTKDELIEQVWPGQVISDAALTHCLAKARKAVEDDGGRQQVIKTQHGRGYRFIAAVTVHEDKPVVPVQQPHSNSEEPGEIDRSPVTAQASQMDNYTELKTTTVSVSRLSWLGNRALLLGLLLLTGGVLFLWSPSFHSRAPTETAPPVSGKPLLAVLPFVNLSGEPQQEYFADGLTEELITRLSRMSGVFVVARNSVYVYKGKAVKASDLGRELGVRYVLEGSIRRDGDRLRVTAQLADTTTDYHLWAERYDRPFADIFALQDDITQNIATALVVKFKEEEVGRAVRQSTNNVEAYDYAARGWEYYSRFTQVDNAQARQLFEKAVALDPQFTVAHIGLGRTYSLDWIASWDLSPGVLEKALSIARHVLVLDDSLPAAHAFLADGYLLQKQHEQAMAAAQQTIILDPSFAYGYVSLATILNCVGRPEEAISLLVEKALPLDPGGAAYNSTILGHSYFLLRRYAEAERMVKRTLIRNPDYVFAHSLLAAVYAETGRQTEAEAELATVLRLSPQSSLAMTRDRMPYKEAADGERMLEALRKAGLR